MGFISVNISMQVAMWMIFTMQLLWQVEVANETVQPRWHWWMKRCNHGGSGASRHYNCNEVVVVMLQERGVEYLRWINNDEQVGGG